VPEEIEVPTEHLRENIEERVREAAGEARREARPRWLDWLAVSTALFAVLAAVAALEAGANANEALYAASQATLKQTQVVDTWSEYQADSLKKYQQQTLITLLNHVGGSPEESQAATDEANRRQALQDQLMVQANQLTEETNALNEHAEEDLCRHDRFAISVTLFQVAIGLAAITALLRLRPLWVLSLAGGVLALLALINGFTLTL
jgi:hypothetical protein